MRDSLSVLGISLYLVYINHTECQEKEKGPYGPYLVIAAGLEPATFCLEDKYSIHLSYATEMPILSNR